MTVERDFIPLRLCVLTVSDTRTLAEDTSGDYLVAEGLSNKAVGERLAYSAKTVETYLSRVYAKTGCRNRVELARFVRS